MPTLKEKIEALRVAGIENLHIICDFDRTLTSLKKGGSSFSPVRRLGFLSEEYGEKAMQLFYHYHPFELDPLIPHDEKSQIMHEWWEAQFHLMIQSGFHKEHLKLMRGQNFIELRNGVREFMKDVAELNIPMLILSAGFGDMIEILLEENKLYTPNVHVVANFMEYDETGAAIAYAPPIIHGLNKCEQELGPYRSSVENRKNVLLVGDMLGDANMANGLPHDTVLKLGFFNSMEEETRPHYLEAFDLVIEKDESWGSVQSVFDQILSGGTL
jgi:cytosolic 5'-nucleotidase 3